MEKVLLINTDEPEEIRVALVEGGRLEEVYVEAESDPTGKGNVYVGRVQNVERGIGAAFVDLGGGVTGFLHVSDIVPQDLPPREGTREDQGETASAEAPSAPSEVPSPPSAPVGDAFGPRKITDLVKPGDLLLVQVSRAPVGQKGPALTTRVSLPGRYVVLLANSTRSGVSRRIENGAGRDRMRALLSGLSLPPGMAVILRTASNGRALAEVRADLLEQFRLFENLRGRLLEGGGPRLVHEESDLVSRAVRDLLPPDVTRVVCDDAQVAARIREYLERTRPAEPLPAEDGPALDGGTESLDEDADLLDRTSGALDGSSEPLDGAEDVGRSGALPGDDTTPPDGGGSPSEPFAVQDEPLAPPLSGSPVPSGSLGVSGSPGVSGSSGVFGSGGSKGASGSAGTPFAPLPTVEVHPGPTPIFHAFGVEAQIEDAFRRTIRLPSGGSIVIDPTEALVAIDVNSGRMTEEEDLETTALKTNLEAVPEVARQLRLRDLGGVIVVDFIDLRERAHAHQVERALRDALRRDRARIRMARIGPFGCLELTRQRIRPALLSVTHVSCPACGGAGRRRAPLGLALRVLREMRARAARSRGHGGMEVRVPPAIADLLRKRRADALAALEAWLTGPFRLVPDATIPQGGWAIRGLPPRGPAPRAPAPKEPLRVEEAGDPAPGLA